ncbi:hypothetical protein OAN22_00585 [Alphaproteobacteria bacterium]|nr:hypothetical protein [Alphaproteobacteria bacterium]
MSCHVSAATAAAGGETTQASQTPNAAGFCNLPYIPDSTTTRWVAEDTEKQQSHTNQKEITETIVGYQITGPGKIFTADQIQAFITERGELAAQFYLRAQEGKDFPLPSLLYMLLEKEKNDAGTKELINEMFAADYGFDCWKTHFADLIDRCTADKVDKGKDFHEE